MEEPKRAKALNEIAEPKVTKSKTDNVEPKRAIP